tara:strand:- start:183 stop:518 length:336 start_codon:yes stop_codon:yes gene_type:complete
VNQKDTQQNSRQKLLDKLAIDLDKAFNERVQAVKKLKIAFDRNQIGYIHFEEVDFDHPIVQETQEHIVKIEKLCSKVVKSENKFMVLHHQFHSEFDKLDEELGFSSKVKED